jgi:hypothetical protein
MLFMALHRIARRAGGDVGFRMRATKIDLTTVLGYAAGVGLV